MMSVTLAINRTLGVTGLLKSSNVVPGLLPNFIKQINTASFPLAFRATPCLLAEPLKKKKRTDPSIMRDKIERKKKKIDKMIQKLQKSSRILKPIEEAEEPEWVEKELGLRKRKVQVSDEKLEERLLLQKNWALYQCREKLKDTIMIDRLVYSQQRALDELKIESEELYQAAIQPDTTLLSFKYNGPSELPPIKNYQPPDGDYINISKDWNKRIELEDQVISKKK